MGKEINYKLPYREDGEDRIIEIKIDFFSIGIARDLDELSYKQIQVSEKWKELLDIGEKIIELKKEKSNNYKKKIKELKDKADEIKTEIMSFGNNVYIDEQHKLIQKILRDNKIKDGILTDRNFWDFQVDVDEIGKFLHAVSHKDDYLKKKQVV